MNLRGCASALVISLFAGLPIFGEVNVPRGYEIVRLIPPERFLFDTQINECGQIVFTRWMGNDWSTAEIFVYDNGTFTRITDNDRRDRKPRINNVGDLIWEYGEYPEPETQVQYKHLPDGPIEVLDENNQFGFNDLDINDRGHAAWTKGRYWDCPPQAEVFFWDGREVSQIQPNHLYFDDSISMNEYDELCWIHKDSCAGPWQSEVHLYANGEISTIPSEKLQNDGISRNDKGDVAWRADQDIVMYDADGVLRLKIDGSSPVLNNRGDIVWSRWYEPQHTWHAWLYVDKPNGWRPYQLTDDGKWSTYIDLNDLGEAAWVRATHGYLDFELLLLRRVRTGDMNLDGDVDLRDHRAFVKCMTGPVHTDGLCMCRFGDVDYDGDVDLADFAKLQLNFAP